MTHDEPAFPNAGYYGMTRVEFAAVLIAAGHQCSAETAVRNAYNLFDVLNAEHRRRDSQESRSVEHDNDVPRISNYRVGFGIAKRMQRIVAARPATIIELSYIAVSHVTETTAARRFLRSYLHDIELAASQGRRMVNGSSKACVSEWTGTEVAMLYLLLIPLGKADDDNIRAVIQSRPGTRVQREQMPFVLAAALHELGVTDNNIRDVVSYFSGEFA